MRHKGVYSTSKRLHQQKHDAARTLSDRYTTKLGCQKTRDAAQTDIPQKRAISKNVTQHGQIYPKTGPSAKM